MTPGFRVGLPLVLCVCSCIYEVRQSASGLNLATPTSMDFTTIFWIAFASIVIWNLYQVIQHGSLKGAAYGARVGETIGEVEGRALHDNPVTIRVHRLEGFSPDKEVGVELVGKTKTSVELVFATLSSSDLDQFTRALRKSIELRGGSSADKESSSA